MAVERVVFLGSKPLGLRCLQTLRRLAPAKLAGVITIDDRADTRTAHDGITRYCEELGMPLRVAADRRHAEALIHELHPDLCIVCGWYWLLRKEILESVPGGFIGIHYSLLPKYRGGAPLVWALINGEPEVGLSIFTFAEGVDSGPIWAQERIPVGPDDYISDVLERLEAKSIAALEATYPGVLNGTTRPWEQEHTQATYCSMRQPSDGEIYWRAPAREVYNFIRAQSRPYPGTFTWLQGEKLVIWRARREESVYYGTPGQVSKVSADGVHVVCGDNRAVVIETVEQDGIEMKAHKALKSVSIRLLKP